MEENCLTNVKHSLRKYSFIRTNYHRFRSIKKKIGVPFQILTSPLRVLPDFIIIGNQKCGTTSLHTYLAQHPNIHPFKGKEIHFFNLYYKNGTLWYKSHFPTIISKLFAKIKGKKFLSGESSPTYLYHPLVPLRVFKLIPKVKLIVIVRNPIDRAFSHYNNNLTRFKNENLTFEEAIKEEEDRLKHDKQKLISDEYHQAFNLMHYPYLSAGLYIDQIKNWLKYFSKTQFLILNYDDFKSNPKQVLSKIFEFLELPNYEKINLRKLNVGKYKKNINYTTRKKLEQYFKPYNKRLENFLGVSLKWDN